jgi:hypothetical protein
MMQQVILMMWLPYTPEEPRGVDECDMGCHASLPGPNSEMFVSKIPPD